MATLGNPLQGRGFLDIFKGGKDPRVGAGRGDSDGGGTLSTSANNKTSSLGKLGATFIPISIYVAICIIVFTVLRRRCTRVYAPRTIAALRAPELPTKALPSTWFGWVVPFFKVPDTVVLNNGSLDAFFFLRFLKVLRNMCLGGCLILWPVLFPIHATGGGGLSELDLLTIGNLKDPGKLYAHAFMAWVFFGFVLYMIVRECIYYINVRQAYLSSPYYAERISSRTILLQCVPQSYLSERRLRKLYGDSVKRVTIPRTTKALANMVKEREQTAMRLEKAEVELIRKVNAARIKQAKKTAKKEAKEAKRVKATATSETHEVKEDDPQHGQIPHSDSITSQQDLVTVGTNSTSDNSQTIARGGCVVVEVPGAANMEAEEKEADADEAVHVVRTDTGDSKKDDEDDEYTHPYGLDPKLPDVRGSVAAQYIPVQQRPYHRPIGNFLRRVDTIRWTRNRLRELNVQIYKMRKQVRRGEGATLPAAFIEFDTQESAQAAHQVLVHHRPLQMSSRLLGVRPDEVIWKSLRMSWWERIARRFLVLSLVTLAVIFWSIPSAAIGLISQIDFLAKNIIVLSWLLKLPSVVVNFLQGFVPAIALSLWMAAVPIMLRFLGRVAGIPTVTMVELFVQNGYFAFQVVQVFLITTLTSAASAAFTDILENPIKAKDILATNLPMASNFYLSYILIQCLASSGTQLLHVFALIRHYALDKVSSLPRARYRAWRRLRPAQWGGVFPVFANMGVIAMSYACIAPLILVFAAGGMAAMRIVWRYNLLYIYDSDFDSKGLFYPRALLHLIIGLYLAEICLIGLFALHLSFGPLAMMVMFFLFTGLVHLSLGDAIAPLLLNLPQTLVMEPEVQREEREAEEKARELARARAAEEAEAEPGAANSYYDTTQTFGEEQDGRGDGDGEDDYIDTDDEGIDTDDDEEATVTNERALEGAGSIKATLTEWLKHTTKSKMRDEVSRSGIPDAFNKVAQWTGAKRDPEKPPGLVARWLHPEEYEDFVALREAMIEPEDKHRPKIEYPPGPRRHYCDFTPPEVWAPRPVLWIPRDEARVSRQEVAHTRKYTPVSDQAASMDDRGRITVFFDKAPLHEPRLML
ncbi:calcium permeable stress-gated cation channel [Purpureocillium lavendulum]|uniref:Calcium permeable stress-gated cation channel n=1 Tax=Purpureocillium lavendulum TaxID=1247861 RepID=A0AB34FUB1_9HYPO|nr:calcium permeable stress-gated cation channel [Purpureocillium lavendulum]